MVEQLVRGFVPEAMAMGLDFTRMERVNAKFHAPRGSRREGDVVWRLPTQEASDVYLHLLFEFQSTVDWWMAVRTQVYTGLLRQQIIAERRLRPGDLLPPVLTIVIYNGDQRWNAPTDLSRLVALPPESPLWRWQPQASYYLLDEGAFPSDDLARMDTVAALLFRLEHCHRVDDLADLVGEVVGWFRDHPGFGALQQLFVEIVAQAAHGVEGQGLVGIPEDLLEARNMLATRAQEWKRQLIAEGRAEGEAIGEANVFLRMLGKRYEVTAETEACVRGASSAQIDEWIERFADSKSLDDIFGKVTH